MSRMLNPLHLQFKVLRGFLKMKEGMPEHKLLGLLAVRLPIIFIDC